MINLIYKEYPFGSAEAFAEYEVHAFQNINSGRTRAYSLYEGNKEDRRYMPDNVPVTRIYHGVSFGTRLRALVRMLSREALSEIALVLKKRPPEGVVRCIYRIHRYLYAAESFCAAVDAVDEKQVFACYWLNECAYAALAFKRKHPGVTVTARGHGFDVFEERNYMPFRKQVLGELDKIFIINSVGRDYLHKTYPWLDMRKVQIEHLGVTVPDMVRKTEKKKPLHVVSCSSVIPLKRLDLLIDALAMVNGAVRWTHFGGGPLESEMKAKAETAFAGRNIQAEFKGQVKLQEVHDFYASEDVHLFVNCSDTEGTPVSIMEAMSYGIPCIARDVGGNREVVDNDCGILLPTRADAHVLATAIERIAEMANDDYRTLRICAREKIEKEFNDAVNYTAYARQIAEISEDDRSN